MANDQNKANYQGLFIIGIALIAVGIATGIIPFMGAGVVFMIIGLAHRDQAQSGKGKVGTGPVVKKTEVYRLSESDGQFLAQISGEQLQFLIDQLEEEFLEDQDYAITKLTIEYLATNDADADLIAILNQALGDDDEVTVVWSRK